VRHPAWWLGGLITAALSLDCATTPKEAATTPANGPTTPLEQVRVLHWVFDDRLNPLGRPQPARLVEGGALAATVDTTQRFGGNIDTLGATPFPRRLEDGRPVLLLPPSMRYFYYVHTSRLSVLADMRLQPGSCQLQQPVELSQQEARPCTTTTETQAWNLPRDPGGNPMPLYVCPSDKPLLPEGATQAPWSLLLKRPTSPEYVCIGSWTLVADPEQAVASVTLVASTNGTPSQEVGAEQAGRWELRLPLQSPGYVSAELRVQYKGGLLSVERLGTFEILDTEQRSLVRLQPGLVTRSTQTVSVAVTVTPVRPAFFEQGPWRQGSWLLNGLHPSVVVRVSGESVASLQFGLAASLFANRAFQFQGGVFFGRSEPAVPWSIGDNWFLGFAIDPTLFSELVSTSATERAPGPQGAPP
jgi:hypothetical protein